MRKVLSMLLIATMVLTDSNWTVFASEEITDFAEEAYDTMASESEEISELIESEEQETAEEVIEEDQEEASASDMNDDEILPPETSCQEEETTLEDGTAVETSVPETVSDAEAQENSGETEIIDSGSCGENLTWELSSDGTLTISGTGPMDDYNSFTAAPWKYSTVKKLVLEEGISSIGSYAFDYCSGITGSLIIPESVLTIGDYAFERCRGFTGDLVIPKNVTTIGSYAFYYCSGFTGDLVIPKSVTTIGRAAFSSCSGFKGALIIPESITTIDHSTFQSCSGFTGDLIIPESVTAIRSSAFQDCSGFTGDLIIPKSVTAIGSSAFRNCSGFDGTLTISESVTEIDDSTFYKCSGLTGDLIIPENVTTIGNYAFSYCSGFDGTLTLSESLTAILEEAFFNCSGLTGDLIIPESVKMIWSRAFYHCNSLSGNAYIPPSVTDIQQTPFETNAFKTIYGESGSYAETYAKSYVGLTFIPYDPKTYEETIEPNEGPSMIYVLVRGGDKIKLPVGKALVNGLVTNSKGYVAIPVTEDGKMQFTISADGYQTLKTQKNVTIGGAYIFTLTPESESSEPVSIVAKLNNTTTNLLTDKLYLQATDENIDASSQKTDLIIEVSGGKDIVKYGLFQEGEWPVENTSGIFTIPIIQKSGKLYTNLHADKTPYIKLTDAKGKGTLYKLGVYIDKVEVETDIDTGNMPTDISIMPNVTSDEMDEDVPYFGGMDASFGFKNGANIAIEIEENGRVKIAVGMEKGKDFKTFKKEFDNLKSKTQNATAGSKTTFDAGKISGGISVCGYGEGFIDKKNSDRLEIKVGIIVSGQIKESYTQPFALWIIPFYVSIEAGLKISAGAEATLIYENQNFDLGGAITLEGEISLTPKAAIGAEVVASLGVSGTGAVSLQWKPRLEAEDYWKIELSGSLGVFGQLGGHEATLRTPTQSWTIYETGQNAVQNYLYNQVLDSGSYTLMDRSYLTQSGVKAADKASAAAVENAVYPDAVYPGASPQLVSAGDKLYLFWLQDIESRSAENRAAVVFAMSADGENWSEPVQLVAETENQTMDDGFDLYVDNGKIYVCWQDAAQEFSSGVSLNEIIRKLNISYAVVDGATGNVEKVETVTETAGSYLQPRIAAKDGTVYIAFISNHMSAEGGIWDADNTEELIRYDSQSNTLTSLTIGDGREKIAGMDMAVSAGGAGIYYTMDQDGDFATIGDRVLVYDMRDGSSGTRMALTGEGQVYSPSVAGETCYWYADGNLYCGTIGAAGTPIYETVLEGIPAGFKAVSDGSNTMLLWSSIDAETEKVSLYGIQRLGDGNWTAPFVIERTDSEMTGETTGAYKNGSLLISYPHIRFQEDGNRIWSLCVTKERERKDISLNYAGYDVADFKPGEKLPITIELSNKGNTAVETADVSLDGERLGSLKLHLGAGETGTFILENYTVPANVTGYVEHTLTVSLAGETETEDNSASIGIGYTDVSVIASQRLQDGSTWLDISVLNQSDIATACTLNIRAKEENGEILYSKELGNISGNSGAAVSLSLKKYEKSNVVYYVEAVPEVEDVIEGNNIVLVYTGFGVAAEKDSGDDEPIPADTYTVIFHSNGGSEVASQQVEAGMTVSKPQDPVREGYRFIGWYLNGEPYDFNTPVTEDITLEAVWEAEGEKEDPDPSKTFTVTFNSNGGSAVPKQQIAEGKTVTEPEAPIREGYRFAGWYLNGELYDFGSPVTEDITLEAVWEADGENENPGSAKKFTVTFNSNGGSEVPEQQIEEGKTAAEPDAPIREGYRFAGWYIGDKPYNFDSPVTEDIILEAHWEADGENGGGNEGEVKEGLWFSVISDQVYTGSAIKPAVEVYYEDTLLKEKTDYTITYQNNKNANDAAVETSAPTVIVNGKGNYTGKETMTFKIQPKNLADEEIDVNFTNAYAYKAGTRPKLSLTVKYGKLTLKKDKDYKLTYKNSSGEAVTDISAVGSYILVMAGQNNYTGTKELPFEVTNKTPVSKLKLSKIASTAYDGTAKEPDVTLKDGKTTLKKGTDYDLSYESNTETGQAAVIITGKGNYVGSRKAFFTITGIKLSKVEIQGLNTSVEYTGKPIVQDVKLTTVVKADGVNTEKTLKEGTDYRINYEKNTAPGKATVILTGKGGYTGTVKKTFTIKAYDIKNNSASKLTISNRAITALYAKGGAKPDVEIRFDGKPLEFGKDYTLSYSNNKAITTDRTTKQPSISITGKGNFKGKLTAAKTFTIVKQDLSAVKTSANDVTYKNKAGNYKSTPVLYDLDGKKLSAGKDYSKIYKYRYVNPTILADGTSRSEGDEAGEKDIVPIGTEMSVTITVPESAAAASGNNYQGEVQVKYHVTSKSLKNAQIKILTNFEYTGKEVYLTKEDIQVTPKGEKQPTTSYEILEDTYKNNEKKGTASVQIRGTGDYGGIVTVKYKIKAKTFRR